MTMLEDLADAKRRSTIDRTCPLCELIQTTEDDETREELKAAAAGKIGRDTLVALLQKWETGIGKRTVIRHREEEHKP